LQNFTLIVTPRDYQALELFNHITAFFNPASMLAMNRRETWGPVLDAEIQRWEAKTCEQLTLSWRTS
jgi:hypothetical protein